LLHSNPALEWVPWVKESPRSLWQLLHKAVTVSALGVCEWGLWQAWHWIPALL
jgi:hypothetical protein